MISLTASLFAVALLGQNAPLPVRVAPETLTWLRNGNGETRRAAEALAGRLATASNVALKNAVALGRSKVAATMAESQARAHRQLQDGFDKPLETPTLISAGQDVTVRTFLPNGDVRYDFSLSSALLIPVSFSEEDLADEKTATKVLSKVVLARLRVPETSQMPLTGNFRHIALHNGHWVYGGVLGFGYTPDANGVYHIPKSKWYDSVSIWTDGTILWVQYSRDDLIMTQASGNPQP